jgi:hypothetical protein
MAGNEPLFSEGEAIATTVVFLILDISDAFALGIPATDFVSWILQGYQYFKGTNGTFQVLSGLLEAIPVIDSLPIRTGAFLMIIWGDRHADSILAKLIKVAGVAKVADSIKGSITKTMASKAAAQAAQASAAQAAAAAEKAAAQGATAAEKAAAQAAAEKSEEAAGKAGEAKAGAKEARKDTAKTAAKEYARQRMGRGSTGEGEGGEEGEGGNETLSPEDQELEDIMSGDLVGQHLLRSMSAEDILATIGEQEKSSRFDPDVMGPEMKAMGPRRIGQSNKGIINRERVDLKNPEKPKEKELLQDAA